MRTVREIAQLGARLLHVSRSTTACRAHLVQRPTAHLRGDRVARRTVATVATVIALIAAASAGAEPPDSVTIGFDAVTTTVAWHGGQALGTFMMTGTLADAGTVRIAYRLFGRRINATATLIGAKAILTIALRATLAPTLDDRQSAVGRWRICGGTGPYRRLQGYGRWKGSVDGLAAPAAIAPRALHGVSIGRIYRGSARRRAGSFPRGDTHC
jgi:hypothetical protein